MKKLPNISQKVRDSAGFGCFWGHSYYHIWCIPNCLAFYCIFPTTFKRHFPPGSPNSSHLPSIPAHGNGLKYSNCFQEMSRVLLKTNKQNFMKISEKDRKDSKWLETSSMPMVWLLVGLRRFTGSRCSWRWIYSMPVLQPWWWEKTTGPRCSWELLARRGVGQPGVHLNTTAHQVYPSNFQAFFSFERIFLLSEIHWASFT